MAGELRPAGAFTSTNKAPNALLGSFLGNLSAASLKLAFPLHKEARGGIIVNLPSMALSCLPLEHNVSLYLKLQENPVQLILWERPKTPRKHFKLLKILVRRRAFNFLVQKPTVGAGCKRNC